MHNGFAISIAWPQTLCKKAGAWYDKPLAVLNINKNGYYKVGHAAVVLIESKSGRCHYFDFGRYHSPYKHGRVRSVYTDYDLEIKTKAILSAKRIINYNEILLELFANESCHGTGALHASYCPINFDAALHFAKTMQNISPIKYGPFTFNGTNCSRFVNSVLLAGKPSVLHSFLLKFPISFSPTPIGNVKALTYNTRTIISLENNITERFFELPKYNLHKIFSNG